jgi:alkylhydroperoxidase family enzyme
MSLLHIPPIEKTSVDVKKIFAEMESMLGSVPNGMKLWSVSPRALKAQWAGMKSILLRPQEEQKLFTIIRYLASNENECSYSIGLNGALLMNYYGVTQDKLATMKKDPSTAPLDKKNKALLIFAMKAIKDADSVSAKDIESLTKLDISEEEMFNIVLAASHMFVVNTLFKTFKVEQDV